MSYLICPKCREKLFVDGNTYKCKNNHSYDISKRGYVNLLLANQMNSLNPGDNKEMMEARRSFLKKGYYAPLKNALTEIARREKSELIIDMGCGEGYYTNAIASVTKSQVIGIDISKPMINEASKEMKNHSNLSYVIASINNLPIEDNSADIIFNCFAPIDINEAKRVLKDDGILVKVTPADYHLYELKELLYDKPYLNPEDDDIKDLKVVNRETIDYKMKIETNEDLINLFKMTPYYHKTSSEAKNKLCGIDRCVVTSRFRCTTYKK